MDMQQQRSQPSASSPGQDHSPPSSVAPAVASTDPALQQLQQQQQQQRSNPQPAVPTPSAAPGNSNEPNTPLLQNTTEDNGDSFRTRIQRSASPMPPQEDMVVPRRRSGDDAARRGSGASQHSQLSAILNPRKAVLAATIASQQSSVPASPAREYATTPTTATATATATTTAAATPPATATTATPDLLSGSPDNSNVPPQDPSHHPSTDFPPAPRKVPKPLLSDPSLYSNPNFVPEADSTSLEELAHLVRLSKYQERKCVNTRIRLHRSLVSAALSARLTRCGEIAYRNLADDFRRDDKDKGFAHLYNAIHDVRRSCDELRRYALLEPQIDSLQSPGLTSSDSLDTASDRNIGISPLGTITPFVNEISATARHTFLDFLVQLRTNPDYVASKFAALSSAELNSFASMHRGLEPVESVLPHNNSGGARSSGRSHHGGGGLAARLSAAAAATGGSSSSDIERLLSFQRHDPLSALLHTCFANSAGPDSAEDRRRTEIWATTCARLISEPNSGTEPFLISILNAWTAMRDWSGRSSMEWFLMKILEDGAFLLDRAEDQYGTRLNVSDWNPRDSSAADEFYFHAVNGLFEAVDDDDGTGIPEGLLELGNAIIDKLPPRYVDSTRKWFVYRWLFSAFLLNVMIHPEAHGLLAEYHITEYGRQKILKEVAMRAQKMVVDMTWSQKSSAAKAAIPPKIQKHVENILGRFRGTKQHRKAAPRLLPARSITSLRETVEVHPYLVVSPADLSTLVNALFPAHQRPQSATSSTFSRSGAASVSCMSSVSQMIPTDNNRGAFETASMASTSLSSTLSDATTSREPLLDDPLGGQYSPPVLERGTFEDDGTRLRIALNELSNVLGPDVVKGSCHPCAERWAVLFVTSNGKGLSTQMTYDIDDELDDGTSSTGDESESEDEDSGPDLSKDYHQLRDSILKLVQEYEIPRSVDSEARAAPLTNRVSGLKKYRSKNKVIVTESSTSPGAPHSAASSYRHRKSREEFDSSTASSVVGSEVSGTSMTTDDSNDSEPVLVTMLTAASTQSNAQAGFVSAHQYWRTLQQLLRLDSPSLRDNGYAVLLNIFAKGPRDSIRHSAAAIEDYDAWLVWLKQSQERHEGTVSRMMGKIRALRDKMWYVTDVRVSKQYEHSRDICVALKSMGMPARRWGSYQRSRASRAPSYMYRAESQIMDLLAASEAEGGPNKLSDDQADKTSRWLEHFGVENFCAGEERIHRFTCEVENCIAKLVGDNIHNAPVLWSSDLFKRDKRILDAARLTRDREAVWSDDMSSVLGGDSERRFGSMGSRRGMSPNAAGSDVSSSVDSGRHSIRRGARSNLSDILDSSEYFGISSPYTQQQNHHGNHGSHGNHSHMDSSSSTFWSPFHSTVSAASVVSGASAATSRAHSPTTSVTNLSHVHSHHSGISGISRSSFAARSARAGSTTDSVHQHRLEEEKNKLLTDLRQSLTSLLLSDLGNLVFARGSETDAWFDGLGQECIDRREALDRKARRDSKKDRDRSSRDSPRPRVIEKKKSFTNLRDTMDRVCLDDNDNTPTGTGPDAHTPGDTASPQAKRRPKDKTADEFPFKKAYQRLLNMFSVHPNPYTKLNALHELEHLIMASQNMSVSRKSKTRSQAAAADDYQASGSGSGRLNAIPLEDAIDNMKERRSQTAGLSQTTPVSSPGINAHPTRIGSIDARTTGSPSPATTEALTNIMQSLFRDRTIRPKTLFRDLQFIAAFVAPSVLDKTERGKSFWNMGLAALGLKLEVCRIMMGVAYEVVEATTLQAKNPLAQQAAAGVGGGGGTGTAPGGATSADESPPLAATPPPPASTYTLADAGRMYGITAREGFPTAQREIALFYLSKPELLERTMLPLSKPREVFKQAVMDKYGGGRPSGSTNRLPSYHHGRGSVGGSGGGGGGPGSASGGIGGGSASDGLGPGASLHPGMDGPGRDGVVDEDGARVGDPRDPMLLCLAMHWMEAAAQGRDIEALTFVRQNSSAV